MGPNNDNGAVVNETVQTSKKHEIPVLGSANSSTDSTFVKAIDRKARSYLKTLERSISSSAIIEGAEDPSAMTIDFLRARLQAQRADYKAEKQRTQQLTRRVLELEQKLNSEVQLRKRAEGESLGISLNCQSGPRNSNADTPKINSEGLREDIHMISKPLSGETSAISVGHEDCYYGCGADVLKGNESPKSLADGTHNTRLCPNCHSEALWNWKKHCQMSQQECSAGHDMDHEYIGTLSNRELANRNSARKPIQGIFRQSPDYLAVDCAHDFGQQTSLDWKKNVKHNGLVHHPDHCPIGETIGDLQNQESDNVLRNLSSSIQNQVYDVDQSGFQRLRSKENTLNKSAGTSSGSEAYERGQLKWHWNGLTSHSVARSMPVADCSRTCNLRKGSTDWIDDEVKSENPVWRLNTHDLQGCKTASSEDTSSRRVLDQASEKVLLKSTVEGGNHAIHKEAVQGSEDASNVPLEEEYWHNRIKLSQSLRWADSTTDGQTPGTVKYEQCGEQPHWQNGPLSSSNVNGFNQSFKFGVQVSAHDRVANGLRMHSKYCAGVQNSEMKNSLPVLSSNQQGCSATGGVVKDTVSGQNATFEEDLLLTKKDLSDMRTPLSRFNNGRQINQASNVSTYHSRPYLDWEKQYLGADKRRHTKESFAGSIHDQAYRKGTACISNSLPMLLNPPERGPSFVRDYVQSDFQSSSGFVNRTNMSNTRDGFLPKFYSGPRYDLPLHGKIDYLQTSQHLHPSELFPRQLVNRTYEGEEMHWMQHDQQKRYLQYAETKQHQYGLIPFRTAVPKHVFDTECDHGGPGRRMPIELGLDRVQEILKALEVAKHQVLNAEESI